MNTPQSWNTLDEAAEYLAAETGEKWTSRKVLDLALKNTRHSPNGQPSPSWIKAAPPRATKFVRCRFDLQAKQVATSPFVPLMAARWQTISLYQAHIGELLACGETLVGIASSPDDPDGEEGIFVILDPEITVTIPMLGVGGIALQGVAKKLIGELVPADQKATEKKTSHVAAPADVAIQERSRPIQAQQHQESEILRVISELGYTPKQLPKDNPGKAGVKAEVRAKLIYSVAVFNKAWERLSASREIVKKK